MFCHLWERLIRKLPARLDWMVAVVVALTAVVPTNGWAHAILVRSTPADGAVMAEAPKEFRLWFDEDISPQFSSAKLLDINGRPLEVAGIRADPSDPKLLIVTLRELPDGVYSVLATTFSEADGHTSRSFLVFGIGEEANLGAAAGIATEAVPPLPEVLLRWCNFTLLAALIGGIAVIQLVLACQRRARTGGAALSTAFRAAEGRVIGFILWCAGLALVVGLGLLFWQAITLLRTLPEGASFESVVWQVLAQTRWGKLWVVREVLLLVLIGLLFFLYRTWLAPAALGRSAVRGRARSWNTIWLAAATTSVGLCVVQALTSHAAAVSTGVGLAVVTDALHLLAAGVWVGGLLALAVALLPLMWRDKACFVALAHAGWGAFSPLAAVAVGLIVATGLYGVSRQVASVDALIGTLFGQTLMFKIGVVLAVGAFGLTNSVLLHPLVAAPLARLLGRPRGWTPLPLRRLPLLILCEGCLALVVLLATGMLTASAAPRGLEFTVASEDVPAALSETIDDIVVTLLVKPNRPGQNVFTVFAASTRRPARAEILRVILRFNNLDQDLGRFSVVAKEIEPGRFLAGGNHLSMAGRWRIDVAVRRRGVEDIVVPFDWVVAPPGAARPVIVSKYPLALPLTLAAAGMLLVIFFALVVASLTAASREDVTRRKTTSPQTKSTVTSGPIRHGIPQRVPPQQQSSDQALAARARTLGATAGLR